MDEIIITPGETNEVTIDFGQGGSIGPQGPIGETGAQGPIGPTGVVNADPPITYNSGTKTVGINQNAISIASAQITDKAAANGVASLDSSGLVPSSQIPPIAITDTFVVASQAAMLALNAQVGDVAIRTDISTTFILQSVPASTLANWKKILTPAQVASVDGRDGVVTLSDLYDASGTASTVQTNLASHTSATTSVHGISNTANLVYTGDSRLTDSRTPTAHASTHGAAGSDPVTVTSAMILNGTILNEDISPSAGIAATKISGLATSATTDTTNASNITSGTLSTTLGGTGVTTGLTGLASLSSANAFTVGGHTITTSAGVVPLSITGASSQSVDLFQVNTSANLVVRVANTGQTGFRQAVIVGGTSSALGQLTNYVASTTTVGIVNQAIANQTADLLQNQSSSATVLAGFNAVGQSYTGSTAPLPSANAVISQTVVTTGSVTYTTGTHSFASGDLVTIAGITTAQGLPGTNPVIVTVLSSTTFSAAVSTGTNGTYTSLSGTATVPAQVSITPKSAASRGIMIRGVTSQAGDLTVWQDATPATVARVTGAGIIYGTELRSLSTYFRTSEENSGGYVQLKKESSTAASPGTTDFAKLYFRDGTTTGTLKLVVRAGTAGIEEVLFDDIDQTGTETLKLGPTVKLASTVGGHSITNASSETAVVPLTLRSASGQTANILEARTTTDNATWSLTSGMSSNGTVFVRSGGTLGAQLNVSTNFERGIGQINRAVPGQVSDILQIQNSSGTNIGGIGPNGQLYSGRTGILTTGLPTAVTISTSVQSASAIITYTCANNHGLSVGQYIVVAGTSETTHNISGTVRDVASTTTFTLLAAASATLSGSGGTVTTTAHQAAITSSGINSGTLVLRGPANKTVTVQSGSGNGTTVTYQCTQTTANALAVGDSVTITGFTVATGSSLNLSGTVASSSATQFTITNTTVGTTSGTGTATVLPSTNILYIQDNTGATVGQWDNNGGVRALFVANSTTYSNGSVQFLASGVFVQTGVASNNCLRIQNTNASPTGDLTQWQNNSGTAIAKVDNAGGVYSQTFFTNQPTPTALFSGVSATLTTAQMLSKIITISGGAASSFLTIPDGTTIESGITPTLATNQSFDWHVINSSSAGLTLTANQTGSTMFGLSGSGGGYVAGNSAAHFRTRKTATNVFVTYQIA